MKENTTNDKFLLCFDAKNSKVYILHREYPACLISVKEETPVVLIIQDLYDKVESPKEILQMPFIQEAREFILQLKNNQKK